MKKLIFTIIIAAFSLNIYAQEQAGVIFETITFTEASEISKQENKFSFVYLYAPGSESCRYFEDVILSDQTVADYVNENYICVALDGLKTDGYILTTLYEIDYYPAIILLDPEGVEIGRIEGVVDTPENFLVIIEKIFEADDAFKGQLAAKKELQRLEAMQKEYLKKQKEAERREKQESKKTKK